MGPCTGNEAAVKRTFAKWDKLALDGLRMKSNYMNGPLRLGFAFALLAT